MIRVRWSDGTEQEAESAEDLLLEMQHGPWEDASPDPRSYLRRVARRGREYTGRPISSRSAEDLLRDLADAGVLEVTEQ